MIEHFFHNAHGEWDLIKYLLMLVPFIGPAIVYRRSQKAKGCCGEDDNHTHP